MGSSQVSTVSAAFMWGLRVCLGVSVCGMQSVGRVAVCGKKRPVKAVGGFALCMPWDLHALRARTTPSIQAGPVLLLEPPGMHASALQLS